MSNIIGAIKIILDQLYNEDATIGLYNNAVGSNSELRWSERELLGVTDDYNYTYIMKNGIGPVSQSIECRLGGNNITVSNFSVSVKGLSQLIIKLNELKIQLSGKTIIYYEFVGSDTDSDSVEIYQQFTGTIEDREYNQFETLITAKSSFALKRNKCLGKTVTTTEYEDADSDIVNQNIPITFGRSDPDNGIYFKLPRLQYRNHVLTRGDIMYDPTLPYLSLFAVVIESLIGSAVTWDSIKANYEANVIQLILGDYDDQIESYDLTHPETLYIKITEDDDSPEGEIRKIDTFDGLHGLTVPGYDAGLYGGYQLAVSYTLEEYFSIVPKPFHDVSGDGLNELFFALAYLIDVLFEYCLDYEESECLISGYEDVFVKESDQMINISNLSIEQDTSDIPIFNINCKIFEEDIGSAVSHTILPVDDIEPYESTTDDLTQFGYSTKYKLVNAINGGQVVKGVYINEDSTGRIYDQPTITGTSSLVKDKDPATAYVHQVRVNLTYPTHDQDFKVVFKVTPPTIDDSIQFDKIYLGIHAGSELSGDSFGGAVPGIDFNTLSGIDVCYKSFYKLNEIMINVTQLNVKYPTLFRSLPDKYYNPEDYTNNKNYYFVEHTHVTPVKLTGYKNYELTGITSREIYNNIHDLLLIFPRHSDEYGPNNIYDTLTIAELAFIFEKSMTIGSEVYA